jgi:sugar phosphate permease
VLAGRPAGGLVDGSGPRPVVIGGALVCAAMVAALGLAGSVGVMAAAWLVAGAGSSFIWAGLNTLAVLSAPANRGGRGLRGRSVQVHRERGGPVLWLPLYMAREETAFLAAAVACAAIALVVLSLGGGPRRVALAAAERARAAAAAAQQ